MKHIGLDVHSTSTYISIFSDRGRETKSSCIPTRAADLVAFMLSIPGPKRAALEESQMADFVTRIITPHVTKVIRCLPQHNRLISESENKCDPEDARSLAELLYLNKLKEVHHAPWNYRQLREGVRAYWTASRELARAKIRLKAFYLFNGVHCVGEGAYSQHQRQKYQEKIREGSGNGHLLEQLYARMDFCRIAKAAHVRILRELSQPFREDVRCLQSCPGIGFVGACTLVAYLQNGWRIKNKRKLWQYGGVGLRRHESAGVGRRGATRKGNRYVKNVLLTAAAAIAARKTENNALTRLWRAGVLAGIPVDRMKRNLARKVAVIAHRALRFKEVYDDDRVVTTQ
jgi:hypothetical protein